MENIIVKVEYLSWGNRLVPILAIAYMNYVATRSALNDLILNKR
jgi:hypothetical protein